MPSLISMVDPAPSTLPWLPGYSMTMANMKEQAAALRSQQEDFSPPPLADQPLNSTEDQRSSEDQPQPSNSSDRLDQCEAVPFEPCEAEPIVVAAGDSAAECRPDVVSIDKPIGRRHTFSAPTNPAFQVDYHGLPVSENAEQAFLRLLQSKPADTRPQVLLPSEIRALSEVLGMSSPVGNNQFTPHTVSPDFYLLDASTMKVNGETVLWVEGNLNSHGVLKSYIGIFMDGGRDPVTGREKIEEVTMQAPPEECFNYRRTFKDVVGSISWSHQ